MKMTPSLTRLFLFLLLLSGFLGGCVSYSRNALMENGPTASPEEAIRNAENILTHNPDWHIDCSHFVLACYHSGAMNAFLNRRKYNHNLVYDLNYFLTQQKTRRKRAVDIQPGDILIFNKTYDINHDGRIDDKDVFTHAGLVESFKNWVVTYIDASESRKGHILRRRAFSFIGDKNNERVARDPATGRKILHLETFYAAYAAP